MHQQLNTLFQFFQVVVKFISIFLGGCHWQRFGCGRSQKSIAVDEAKDIIAVDEAKYPVAVNKAKDSIAVDEAKNSIAKYHADAAPEAPGVEMVDEIF